MAEAVRYADEILQLEHAANSSVQTLSYQEDQRTDKVIEDQRTDKPHEDQRTAKDIEEQRTDKLDTILKAIEGLVTTQTAFITAMMNEKKTPNPIGPCYYCNKQGHVKKECRKLRSDLRLQEQKQQSGNEWNPAQ
jgi:hypothetical protein